MSKTAPAHKTNDDSTHSPHYLMWFRRDLRLHDNTALSALCQRANEDGASVSAVFFITPEQWQIHDRSTAQVDHILRTLLILADDLQNKLNISLRVYVCAQFSDCVNAISELCDSQNISLVMANHEYEGREITRDEQLTDELNKQHKAFVRWHDQCILPPCSITTNDNDSMYKVFTPFYKKWRETLETGALTLYQAKAIENNKSNNKAISLKSATDSANTLKDIESLTKAVLKDYQESVAKNADLKPIDIESQLKYSREHYPAGEHAAKQRLAQFVADDINDYNVSRDKPSLQGTSHMSAYLTIGAISARQCYLQANNAQENLHSNDSDNVSGDEDINRWISELAWRDFYRHVLVDKPELIRHQAYKDATDKKINWSYNKDDFAAWRKGMTGVPLVDAAMRSLNATGFMHNRLRMVTAMFLTKDLLIDWRWGERYFLQQLIDGDFASNNGGWQWSASTGTDSAPYFRIMNPFSQAKSHDTKAIFIKTWLPELKDIPAPILHSEDKLRKALNKDGEFAEVDYPVPMVEHKAARKLAIAEFKKE